MKKIISIIILTLIMLITISIPVFATEVNSQAIDDGGNKLLQVLQAVGFWVVVIKGIYDIIKCAMNHDKKAVGDTLITYMMIAGAMYGMPAVVTMIKNFFS